MTQPLPVSCTAIARGLMLLASLILARPGSAYEVELRGSLGELEPLLRSVSDGIGMRGQGEVGRAVLEQRALRDRKRFEQALNSRGHYRPRLRERIEAPGSSGPGSPARLIYEIEIGPLYRFREIQVVGPGGAPAPAGLWESIARTHGIVRGQAALAGSILEMETALLRRIEREAHPFPRATDRRVVVDHDRSTVDVTFVIDTGGRARFGRTSFQGLASVEEVFLREKVPWSQGEPYDPEKVAAYQRTLADLGLFGQAQVSPGPTIGPGGHLPIVVSVKERKHRTIAFGVTYKTDEKLGGRGAWEHRNLAGEGEHLAVVAEGSSIGYSLGGTLRKPAFLEKDQSLVLDARAALEDPLTFTSRNFSTSAQIERALGPRDFLRGGITLKASEVEQLGVEQSFSLLMFPIQLELDRSDDLLDPGDGYRLAAGVTPFFDPSGRSLSLVKGLVRLRHYRSLSAGRGVILASRIAAGGVTGDDLAEIPADERFYAGGGGSIRGYAYKTVGPAGPGGTTIGGASLVEVSSELRLRVTETVGLVAFVDGGGAFDSSTPGSLQEVLWGAGVGARYYTGIGPLRLDVAVPLDRRAGIDAGYQLYMSLGQAF